MTPAGTRRPNLLLRAAFMLTFGLVAVGCGSTAPSNHSARPVASPSGVATPIPAATASSADLVGHAYVLAAVTAFRSDPLVTHVALSSSMTTSNGGKTAKGTVAMTMDLADRELQTHLVIKSGGKTTRTDLVVVGKTAYARVGSGAWKKSPRNGFEKDISDTIDGLRLIRGPSDLRYVGVETIDKRALHHLTATQPLPYTPSNGAIGRYDTLDLWIEEDGTPVLVKVAYSATSGGVTVKGTSEYRFSAFGGPIKIVAPSTK